MQLVLLTQWKFRRIRPQALPRGSATLIPILFVILSFMMLSATASAQSKAAEPQTATVHVDVTPGHAINSFDPDSALGSSIDVLSRTGIDRVYTPHIIQEVALRGMGADHLPQQYRAPHGRVALDRKWHLERCCTSERILHRQHRTQGADPLHPGLRAAASRIRDQRRSTGARVRISPIGKAIRTSPASSPARATRCIRSGWSWI